MQCIQAQLSTLYKVCKGSQHYYDLSTTILTGITMECVEYVWKKGHRHK